MGCPRMVTSGWLTARSSRVVISRAPHVEAGVHAGDDEVERGQRRVVQVERAVGEHVDLDAVEEIDARRVAPRPRDGARLLARAASASSPPA